MEPGDVSGSLHIHPSLQPHPACTSAPFIGTIVEATHLTQTYETKQYLQSVQECSAMKAQAHFLAGSLNAI